MTALSDFLSENPQMESIDVLVIDLCGNAIGKRLPISAAPSLFSNGTPVCAAMQLVDVLGNTADPMGYGFSDGDPDGLAIPIHDAPVAVPWLDGRKCQVLCQMHDAVDHKIVWYDPRAILQNVLNRFDELPFQPVIAAELEFYFIAAERLSDGAPLPVSSPRTGLTESQGRVLSLDKLDEFESVLSAIETACRQQNLPVTSMISEYGAGQFEINLQHQSDVLAAADHAALLRRAITGVSRSCGIDATFLSKPFEGESGNGFHVHLSLVDKAGNNVFSPDAENGDALLSQAAAGLAATMGESMALFAPNLNVYRRFKPDEFVPVTRDWGDNNRSVAFRVPPSPADSRRLEHRVSGAEANPYLVFACVLAGIHYGLTQALDGAEKTSGNAGASVDSSLPLTLWQALDQLDAATILPDYLGSDYISLYSTVKREEFAEFMSGHFAREYAWYL
ncbi:MAG: glutamine synthetase family protein [Pseudomonadota bacterium]